MHNCALSLFSQLRNYANDQSAAKPDTFDEHWDALCANNHDGLLLLRDVSLVLGGVDNVDGARGRISCDGQSRDTATGGRGTPLGESV